MWQYSTGVVAISRQLNSRYKDEGLAVQISHLLINLGDYLYYSIDCI